MPTPTAKPLAMSWRLTEFDRNQGSGRTAFIKDGQFVVGRSEECALCISVGGVSKKHAELSIEAGGVLVRDLGSTNGTYVNGRRIESKLVAHNDVVQFAGAVYIIEACEENEFGGTLEESPAEWAQSLIQFDNLMNGEGVVIHYQPILRLEDESAIGYEALGRSTLPGLESPAAMFSVAEQLRQERSLSELLRLNAAVGAQPLTENLSLYVNTHPEEVGRPELIESLTQLREATPDLTITLEIHEAAVTCRSQVAALRETLRELDMSMAYDDFGAGQARLDELAESPPDVLKFDMKLIRDIDTSPTRMKLVASLVEFAQDLNVVTLAEGVETKAEVDCCRAIGFELAQGYYYGRPAPFDEAVKQTR